MFILIHIAKFLLKNLIANYFATRVQNLPCLLKHEALPDLEIFDHLKSKKFMSFLLYFNFYLERLIIVTCL